MMRVKIFCEEACLDGYAALETKMEEWFKLLPPSRVISVTQSTEECTRGNKNDFYTDVYITITVVTEALGVGECS